MERKVQRMTELGLVPCWRMPEQVQRMAEFEIEDGGISSKNIEIKKLGLKNGGISSKKGGTRS